ncbi:hypothetical protein ACLOJK_027716 [Asimina triloba]
MAALSDYDRQKVLKAFDDTKAGVKGLVDAGISKIPRIFIIPPEEMIKSSTTTHVVNSAQLQIPTIDLQGVLLDGDLRQQAEIVDKIRQASSRWGFFQVPQEVKVEYYTRDTGNSVLYSSNFDLYQSKAANWRDTLYFVMAPKPLDPLDLPAACRYVSS